MTNPSAGLKAGGLVLLAGFVLMFGSSVVYRITNPSRVIHRQVQPQVDHGDAAMPGEGMTMPGGMPPAMGGGTMGGNPQAMAEIGRLMGQLQQNPDDVDTLVAIGKAFLEADAVDRAESFANRALAAAPQNPEALNLAAVAAFAHGHHEQSAEYFEKLVAVQPDDGPAWYNLGMLYKHHLKQPGKAAAAFEKALPLAEQDPELKTRLDAELNN